MVILLFRPTRNPAWRTQAVPYTYLLGDPSMAKYPYQTTCPQCGNDFWIKSAPYKTTFCSRNCAVAAQTIYPRLSNCLNCSIELTRGKFKFCSQSCSATYNNSKRTHSAETKFKIKTAKLRADNINIEERLEKEKELCKVCQKPKKYFKKDYCSAACRKIDRPRMSAEEARRRNAEAQSQYRTKKYRTFAPDADREKMREIYRNCPPGYEVDHIIPLSKGGLHHQDNLQYLLKEENRRKSNKLS